MKRSICLAVLVSAGVLSVASAQSTQRQADEDTLRSAGIGSDAKSLITYFTAQSLKDGDQKLLENLVRKLGSDVFLTRDRAYRELLKRGAVAIPFLKAGLTNSSLEAVRRANDCIKDIEEATRPERVAAAARILAASKDPKAAEVLFNFAPSVSNDPYLEEEILMAVGRLTIDGNKVDPLLLNALKDPLVFRRTAAAYVIGRRAGPDQRDRLRALLADPDSAVKTRITQALYGKRAPQMLEEAVAGDEKLLKDNKIDVTDESLLKYFRDRTLDEAKQRHFRSLVRQMGSKVFATRMQATDQLTKMGAPVIAFLKEAEYDNDVELARRARESLHEIRTTSNPAIPIAAAHLLAKPTTAKDYSPAEAIRVLLAYIPFTDDDIVEEEVLTSLTLLSIREPKIEPELVKALTDTNATRRGAAAYVLGHVGGKEEIAKVPALLHDPQPLVRLRASQGLLAARDKQALPSFVKLIDQVANPYLPKIEEVLYRVAEDKGPAEAISGGSSETRQKAAKAWAKWLQDNDAKIDLASLNDREAHLGLITVCEYTNQFGNIMGQVWEGNRTGQKRWTIGGVQGAMDAVTLPNGNILVAENNLSRVTERDSKGNIKWTYSTQQPLCVQRLPNGNTFIASYQYFIEVTPNQQVVYRINPGNQFYFFSAHKTRNGKIVAINARNLAGGPQGSIVEMDTTGKILNTIPVQAFGNWCSVEAQPNGNYLVALQALNGGTIVEYDRKGKELWSKQMQGAFRATKLPNGNVLAASMNTRQVAEIDRTGNVRWSVICQGQPWGLHYR